MRGTAVIRSNPSARACRSGPNRGQADAPSSFGSGQPAVARVDDDDLEYDPLNDALDRARAGDESGFLELWRDLQPRLLRYLRVQSGQGSEDVAAETWLQVVRDLSNFIGDVDGFRAWLFTIARHRAIDAARSAAARPLTLVADVAETVGAGTAASAESEALERVSTEQALELVATLPHEQAEMVMLRVVAGLDVAVVADIVGKSPGAVRVSVHRGLRALSRNPQAYAAEVS